MKHASPLYRSLLEKAATGIALGAMLIMMMPAAAHAMPRRGDDRDWHRHEVYAHRGWYRPHPAVYAPPVVYAPPPVEESPGLNLIIPFNIN